MPSSKDSNRREFLQTLITGAAGISLSYQAFGRPQSAAITANRLTDNVAVITRTGRFAHGQWWPSGTMCRSDEGPFGSVQRTARSGAFQHGLASGQHRFERDASQGRRKNNRARKYKVVARRGFLLSMGEPRIQAEAGAVV